MNGNNITIPIILFIGLIIAVFYLLDFHNKYKDVAQQFENLKVEHSKLNNDYNELKNEYSKLQEEHSNLQTNYEGLKKDTAQLLAEYAATETLWEFIGVKKLRYLCGAVKITLRDTIPESQKLPC